jgi:hypothetical protein
MVLEPVVASLRVTVQASSMSAQSASAVSNSELVVYSRSLTMLLLKRFTRPSTL